MSLLRSSARTLAPLRRALHTTAVRRDHFLDATPEVGAVEGHAHASNSSPVLVTLGTASLCLSTFTPSEWRRVGEIQEGELMTSWCQPCRVLQPLLKSVTGPESGFDLLTIDVDKYPEVAGQYKVSGCLVVST